MNHVVFCSLCIALCGCVSAPQSGVDDFTVTAGCPEREAEVQSSLPNMPQSAILSGHLIVDGKWYVLDSEQIATVCRARKRPLVSMPRDMTVQLPPLGNIIILWTSTNHGLKPDDVLQCDDGMFFINSDKDPGIRELVDTVEQKKLLMLMSDVTSGRSIVVGVNPLLQDDWRLPDRDATVQPREQNNRQPPPAGDVLKAAPEE